MHGWLWLCFLSSAHFLGHIPRNKDAAKSRHELVFLPESSQACSESRDALGLGRGLRSRLVSLCPSAVPHLSLSHFPMCHTAHASSIINSEVSSLNTFFSGKPPWLPRQNSLLVSLHLAHYFIPLQVEVNCLPVFLTYEIVNPQGREAIFY